jgi:hypothetical protein
MALSKLILNKSDKVQNIKTMEISIHSWKLLMDHSKNYHSTEKQPVSPDKCINCVFFGMKNIILLIFIMADINN